MIADVIVMFDEGSYLPFEINRQVVVVEQNAVLQVWCHRSIFPWVWG